MAARVRNARPAYRRIARFLRQAILRNFEQEGWYPRRWKRSLRAVRDGGQTLTDSGKLRRSIKARSTGTYAAAGTRIGYAAIHQYGGRCGRKGSVHVPARPFLPVDAAGQLEPALGQQVRQTMLTWITKGK
jgi:phage virion morphogenesis protein